MESELPKLTQFSPGAGCGCKISPKDLHAILQSENHFPANGNLLVGYESSDDAAVYDLGNGMALISTTDFFTPIVDDPFNFGRIAATNAISDVFAMGGTPILAISILGWPLDKLPAEIAREVIEGARQSCREAGIVLAGGHSIQIADPIFGLAVNGIIPVSHIKRNKTATAGCHLFLTKPLGVGILTTAEKKGLLRENHKTTAVEYMVKLNNAGFHYSGLEEVKAMTDVTGFGLLGHLLEICEGSGVSASLKYQDIPMIDGVLEYVRQKAIPGGTFRNWKSYGEKIGPLEEEQKMVLCDPQTSGGLLVAVSPEGLEKFRTTSAQINQQIWEIGVLTSQGLPRIEIL